MNMSYCRVRNTVDALRDVVDHVEDVESDEERKALVVLVSLAMELIEAVSEE